MDSTPFDATPPNKAIAAVAKPASFTAVAARSTGVEPNDTAVASPSTVPASVLKEVALVNAGPLPPSPTIAIKS